MPNPDDSATPRPDDCPPDPQGTTSDESAALSSAPNGTDVPSAGRHPWLLGMALVALAFVVAAGALRWLLPPGKYTAYAKLWMPDHPEVVLYPETSTDFESFQRTQVALIRSRLVLNAALGNPKVQKLNLDAVRKGPSPVEGPVEWLEKEIKVEFPDGPEIPRISLSGDNPFQLRVLVSAVVEAYLDEVNKEKRHRQERLDQLERVYATYNTKLKRLQEERNAKIRAYGLPSDRAAAFRQESAQRQLALAEQELTKTVADLRRAEVELKVFEARAVPDQVPDRAVDASVDKKLEADLDRRDALAAKLAEARTRGPGGGDPKPTPPQQAAELEALDKAIAARRAALRPRIKARLLEKARTEAGDRRARLDEQVAFLNQYKARLIPEIERLRGEAKDVTKGAIEIGDNRLELAQAEAGVTRVMGEIDKLNVEKLAPPRVSRLEEVVVVAPDDTIRRLVIAGGSAAGAIAAGLLVVLLTPRRRHRPSAGGVVHGSGPVRTAPVMG
jgi:hypothetical protein